MSSSGCVSYSLEPAVQCNCAAGDELMLLMRLSLLRQMLQLVYSDRVLPSQLQQQHTHWLAATAACCSAVLRPPGHATHTHHDRCTL
jgi:hypothetical protein